LLGSHTQGVCPLLAESSLDQISRIGQLDAGVSQRGAAIPVEKSSLAAYFFADMKVVAREEPLVAMLIGNDFRSGRDLCVPLNQTAYGRRQTGSKPPGSKKRNFVSHDNLS